MSQPVRVGLVGFGLAGRVFHAPFIATNPRLALTHVVERHRNESKAVYPHVAVVRHLDDLLVADGPELIVLATPNATHVALALQVLKAGRHVVIDKPFAPTSADCVRLIEVAARRGCVLSVYQNRRWDGDFRTVQQIVKAGQLGRLVEYEAHFDRFRPHPRTDVWREQAGPAAGLLYDLGSHLIDQALVLFGTPESVTADVRIQREGSPIDDGFEVVLGYPSAAPGVAGLKVTLKASKIVREPGPHFLLHGLGGSFIKYGMDPQEAALLEGRTPANTPDWGVDRSGARGTLHLDVDGRSVREAVETLPGCYQAFYDNVYDVIRDGRTLEVTGGDGLRTIRTIELAFSSSAKRCTLPWSLQ